jgi:hypothetical protein
MSFREFNRTIDDPCAMQQRNDDNAKKLKFITTNYADLIEAKDTLNFYGMTMVDQLFVPADKIDTYSQLIEGKSGNIMTHEKARIGLGQLPLPTTPARYQIAHGDVTIEDGMRNQWGRDRASCNPKDTHFYDHSFYIFDDKAGIETPNPVKSVEPQDFGPRGGVSTRYMKKN